MKNESGQVIYVGKANHLKNRVRSYFRAATGLDIKTRQLVQKITDIEWIVLGSELEALILEMNLIKKHRPHYNIRLKDDKRYPYIKVHTALPFPKVTVTRRMENDGSRYFGPYTSTWAVHQTLDVLRRIFPYLTCDRVITGKDPRPCLYFDIQLCSGPCIGAVNQQEYRHLIEDLCNFLEGKTDPIVTRMQNEMEQAAEDLRFERAASLRDQIQAIEKVVEKQKVVSTEEMDSDVVAMARADGEACVQIFFIRSGKLIGREYFILEGTEDEQDGEIIAQFIKQFYSESAQIPSRVLLPQEIEEAAIIKSWLRTRQGCTKTDLVVPRSGTQQELIQMATENAVDTLRSLRTQWEADKNKQSESLADIQLALNLAEPPGRIECYDISNTQGTAAVGSMVVFEQGTPRKSFYRRFNIKNVVGPDDFASMEEVLNRRFNRWKTSQEDLHTLGKKTDLAFSLLPDLLIVDGGKGQLSRAVAVLRKYGLQDNIVVAGLAKQQEEIFMPGREAPILLPRHSQGLYLLQRIRDEAHRFAITAHRNKRSRLGMASRLDNIPGIGPARRKALIMHFGSVEGILNAQPQEIASLPGINQELAQQILNHLEE